MPVNFNTVKVWYRNLLSRSTHRSFQLTRRRDYVRQLTLPGYISFTHYVNKTIWTNRSMFLGLAAIYIILFVILVGIGSQETYKTLVSTLQETGSSITGGDVSKFGEAGVLFLSIATTGITETPTESQQIYAVLLGLLVWLTTVWLLRNRLAGHAVKLRDALYNAGAPIIPLFLTVLVLAVQLIPVLLAFIAYSAASASGLLDSGVEAMLFWFGMLFLVVLSLFWATATFFAMIIVSLPGMKPMEALRSAGELVMGRRVRILLRWLWMLLVAIVVWACILIPIILLDVWLSSVWTSFDTVPLVPITLGILSTLSVIWISSYVYLLYRKVVDGSTK